MQNLGLSDSCALALSVSQVANNRKVFTYPKLHLKLQKQSHTIDWFYG